MPNHSLRTINIIIGIILLIIGSLFVSVNFFSPHAVLIEAPNQDTRSLGAIEDFRLIGYYPKMIQPSPDDIYRYLPAVNVTTGQTLRVFWYSDIFLDVFIFSEEQFAYFQSILQNLQFSGVNGTESWKNAYGITYEAYDWGKKNTIVSYNVTETGNYVAVITNGGLSNSYVSYFSLDLIFTNQTTEKQSDSLYLYIGVFFVILGIALLTLTLVKQKT
jgi:hypothetical protein